MVTTFFPPFHFGGDAVFTANLSNALAAAGHDVEVIHCADSFELLRNGTAPSGFDLHPNILVHKLNSRFGLASPVLTQITGDSWGKTSELRKLFSSGFDVVHFHNVSLIGLDALRIPSAVRLCTLHDYWWICPTHILFKNGIEACEKPDCLRCQIAHGRPPQLWRFGSKLRRASESINRFISPSRFVQQRYRSTPPYIESLVLPHFIPEIPALGKQDRGYYFFAGRLERAKGLQEVIPLFLKTGRRLLIAGAGTFENELRDLAADSTNIVFLGRVPHSELAGYYAGARATIVPSICHETFGLAVLESLAQGTAVIASNYGALGELTRETGAGFVYQSEIELENILNAMDSNRSGERDVALNAHNRLPEYGIARHLSDYFEIIESARR